MARSEAKEDWRLRLRVKNEQGREIGGVTLTAVGMPSPDRRRDDSNGVKSIDTSALSIVCRG